MKIIYHDKQGNIHKYREFKQYADNAIPPSIKELRKETDLEVSEIGFNEINESNFRYFKFDGKKLMKRGIIFLTPDEKRITEYKKKVVEKRNILKSKIEEAKTLEEKVEALEKYINFRFDPF